jgi:hypothetical protein
VVVVSLHRESSDQAVLLHLGREVELEGFLEKAKSLAAFAADPKSRVAAVVAFEEAWAKFQEASEVVPRFLEAVAVALGDR